MWQLKHSSAIALFAFSALASHQAEAAAVTGGSALRQLRQADTSLVLPLTFDQKLLVCNAYPSDLSMTVRKNTHDPLTGKQDAIPFGRCRYMPTQVQKQDKLTVQLADEVVEGSFEVGDLPEGDSVLLLVVKRHPESQLVTFSSFAFPTSAESKEAQLAVIDAFSGKSSTPRLPHLRVEEHMGNKEKMAARRKEELNFNRVYTIEEGTYDASVMEEPSQSVSTQPRVSSNKLMRLVGNRNYVVLNTGDGGKYPESLVVFPDEPLPHSAGSPPSLVHRAVLLGQQLIAAVIAAV